MKVGEGNTRARIGGSVLDKEIRQDLNLNPESIESPSDSFEEQIRKESFRHANPATLLMAEKLRDAMLG